MVVLLGDRIPPFYFAVDIGYDGNSRQYAIAGWFEVENRSTHRWENSGNFHKIGRWRFGWKYDGSDVRNMDSFEYPPDGSYSIRFGHSGKPIAFLIWRARVPDRCEDKPRL